jgi:hypothetical protein
MRKIGIRASKAKTPAAVTFEGTDPKDSLAVRQAFFAKTGFDTRKGMTAIGWDGSKKTPHWLSSGNIPWYWRERMWEFVGGHPQ